MARVTKTCRVKLRHSPYISLRHINALENDHRYNAFQQHIQRLIKSFVTSTNVLFQDAGCNTDREDVHSTPSHVEIQTDATFPADFAVPLDDAVHSYLESTLVKKELHLEDFNETNSCDTSIDATEIISEDFSQAEYSSADHSSPACPRPICLDSELLPRCYNHTSECLLTSGIGPPEYYSNPLYDFKPVSSICSTHVTFLPEHIKCEPVMPSIDTAWSLNNSVTTESSSNSEKVPINSEKSNTILRSSSSKTSTDIKPVFDSTAQNAGSKSCFLRSRLSSTCYREPNIKVKLRRSSD